MNGFQNRKGQDLQKPFPGCMGRMINIFDMSTGLPRTKLKLLTEKPHRDESLPTYGNRSDVVKKKPMGTFGVQKEEKTISSNLRKSSSNKSSGTPMKMLIAREMSREPHFKQKPSNVVAKLMGLDTLPIQQSVLTTQRSLQEGYSHNSSSGEIQCFQLHEDTPYSSSSRIDSKSSANENGYKDVHEVWQQPSRDSWFKGKPPQNIRHDENPLENRMALVQQKFTEAKRLATNEKLLQSKEFQEALEVLSSNRDLFLKFLEEPSALFSRNLLRPNTPSSQTRRITLLKPSKKTELKVEARESKLIHRAMEGSDCGIGMNQRNLGRSNSVHHKTEDRPQPTRIVVLKPSLGMPHELKAGATCPLTSSKLLEGSDCDKCLGHEDPTESREVVKEITLRMQEYAISNLKDESSLSSALTNGYIGDESSLNVSENDHTREDSDNASDSESLTPTSRHPWDYSIGVGSPFSISSCSQTSFSPEPYVIKEAKKRLSERLAMVSSNGTSQEQTQVWRSSSTLGEMLSITEVKNKERADNFIISSRRSYGGEQDQRASTACLSIGGTMEGYSEDPRRSFSRSKSVPISSSVYEDIGLREKVSDSTINKSIVPKEMVGKSKSGMSSFKGKVSSLFLSRIKKVGREKAIPSCFLGSDHSETSGKRNDAASGAFHHYLPVESDLVHSAGRTGEASSSSIPLYGPKHDSLTPKASFSFENSRENQEQPSPISVLEAPFEDDANSGICQPSSSAIIAHPQALSRSPPIGSVSRTLTWENPREIPLHNSLKLSRVLSRECEEQERYLLVHKLLSSANLLDNAACSSILARWYSLDSPLDPRLLDEFLDRKEEDAKCRERRSNQRLLFDCINAALFTIGQGILVGSYPWATAYGCTSKDLKRSIPVADQVTKLVKDLFSCEERQVSGEAEDQNFVAYRLVKGEIAGRGWAESMCLELNELGREIGEKMLEELLEEALADLNDWSV